MKKILTILLIALSLNAFAVINDPGQSNSVDNLGAIVKQDVMFINVLNSEATATLLKGQLVVADLTDDNGFGVVSSSVSAVKPMCMLLKDLAVGEKGRCQVYGYTDILLFDASVTASAGEKIYVSGDNSGYSVYILAREAGTSGLPSVADALDASSVSGAIEAYLRLL